MAARITLKDLAAAAGVSLATASLALRNDRNASRATCERVQALAREMGYRPDPVIASLAARRFHTPGQLRHAPLVFATQYSGKPSASKARYVEELGAQAQRLGYSFKHYEVGSREELARAARRWYHQGVRGVVFGLFEEIAWVREVDLSAFSLVFLGGSARAPLLNTVKADVARGVELAWVHAGAGRIGVVVHRYDPPLRDDQAREGMARSLLAALPARRRVPIHLESYRRSFEEQTSRLSEWIARHKPERILGQPALAPLLDDERRARLVLTMQNPAPRFPGAVEPMEILARRAVEWLDTAVRHGERGLPERPVELLVPPIWADAGSADL